LNGELHAGAAANSSERAPGLDRDRKLDGLGSAAVDCQTRMDQATRATSERVIGIEEHNPIGARGIGAAFS
jgi:hypothetical protein